jgi:hypothetical protein
MNEIDPEKIKEAIEKFCSLPMEQKEEIQKNLNNVFTNKTIQSAKNSLPEEDKKKYASFGESMFKDIDFEKSSVTQMIPGMEEALIDIENMIKSGMHISLLEEDEKNLLNEIYGEEWYKKYGYVKKDLTDIITIL